MLQWGYIALDNTVKPVIEDHPHILTKRGLFDRWFFITGTNV